MLGTGWEGPEMMWLLFASFESAKPLPETEEWFEATDAFCAARSRESSRVRRLTTASCSFSNCKCSSAAVSGRGCLTGPGPYPTPVLSTGIIGLALGEPSTASVLEGRMFGSGAMRGEARWVDCLREPILEDGVEMVGG